MHDNTLEVIRGKAEAEMFKCGSALAGDEYNPWVRIGDAKVELRSVLKDYIRSLKEIGEKDDEPIATLFKIYDRLSSDLALLEGDKKE